MYKRLILVALAGAWSLQVLGQDIAKIELSDAWIRALPPMQPATAAYVSLANRGAELVTVTGASTHIAARVEIHTTREVDGLMRMEQLEQLELAPGAELSLAPGGTHLMLLELSRMPVPGETVSLCLEFGNAGSACTEASVRKSAGDSGAHQHHQHHQE